jgi:threonine aldolase
LIEFIDLRSDTVTKPDAEMRNAMARAQVGEELYREDATVNDLQQRAAEVLGHDTSLFVLTGTMGNLIALKAHTSPGDEVIFEARSHIYNNEMGGFSAFCGLVARPVLGNATGMLSREQIRRSIRPTNRSHTSLVCLENTHAFTGGQILPQSEVVTVCSNLRDLEIAAHLDGARLGNASLANGKSLAEMASPFDSVMFDFSKGLGAPAGAVLAGNAEFIARARHVRKLLGGEIHQPGILAGACLYGLIHRLPRLREDHTKARRLADGLSKIDGIIINANLVVTNIVLFRLEAHLDAASFLAELRKRGVLASSLEDGHLRLVTHLDVKDADVTTALGAVEGCVRTLETLHHSTK